MRVSGVRSPVGRTILAASIAAAAVSTAVGQDGYYHPLDQNAPPGRVALWSAQNGKGIGGILQPVRVDLPSTGTVTIYNGGRRQAIPLVAAAHFSVGAGYVYRLKLSDMPEFPGVELYPTIEIIDRLHPPLGRAQQFPVPIKFTEAEMQSAIDGRLMTKVVYVEQPKTAVTGELTAALLSRFLPPDRNLLIEAHRVGRPMILVRLGGRSPSESRPDDEFFGPPAPISAVPLPPVPAAVDSGRAVVLDAATTFTPADPRTAIEGDNNANRLSSRRGLGHPTPPRPVAGLEPIPPPWEQFPDEYLLDGGDRGFPVHETRFQREGLESEDAVTEYVDSNGARHILPTNRVAIYSPRFGSVSTAAGLEAGITVARAASTIDMSRGEGLRNRVTADRREQRMPSQSVRVRTRASGLERQDMQLGLDQDTRLSENFELAGSVEDVQSQNAPALRQAQAARIRKLRNAAMAWTRDQFPIVTGSLAGAQEISARFVINELVGVEDRRRRGRLAIVKLADKQVAPPGSIVNFAIEYENIGDLELREVRIIDNLTPRLELVEGSASSDRPADFAPTDNGEGSSILTWTLKDPLPGKSKGTVRFQARVQ